MDEVEVVLRQGTSAEWAASGLVLGQGEMGYDTDLDQMRVGDGTSVWSALLALTSGGGAMLQGDGDPEGDLLPLDGINDPWRWSGLNNNWESPTYAVTYTDGDIIPAFEIPVGAQDMAMYIIGGPPPLNPDRPFAGLPLVVEIGGSLNSYLSGGSSQDAVFVGAGTAYVYMQQNEPGYTHTVCPDPTVHIEDYLGDDVGAVEYIFDPILPVGRNGDLYIDRSWGRFHAKTNGTWVYIGHLIPAQ